MRHRIRRTGARLMLAVALCAGFGGIAVTEAAPASAGDTVDDLLTVGRNGNGTLEAFVVANSSTQSYVYHKWQNTPSGGWGAWASLGTPTGPGEFLTDVDVATNADGRLELFAVSTYDVVYQKWQTSPRGAWSAWTAYYGPVNQTITQLEMARNADGRLEVFVGTEDGTVYHMWQTSPGAGWVDDWYSLGDLGDIFPIYDMHVVLAPDGRLQVFVTDLQVFTKRQVSGGWSGWANLSAPVGSIYTFDVATNADGRLEIFGVTAHGEIYHKYQLTGGTWSSWYPLDRVSDNIVAARNADGRLEVFTSTASAVYHRYQTQPNGGWSSWYLLSGTDGGGPGIKMLTTANADGRLEVWYRDPATGNVYHNYQLAPNGGWGGWFAP